MLRAAVKAGTELGVKAKAIMDSGGLVSDDIIIGLVKERIAEEPTALPVFSSTAFRAPFPRLRPWSMPVCTSITWSRSPWMMRKSSRLSGRRVHPGSGRVYHVRYNPPKVEGVDDETGEPLVQRDDDREETVRKRLAVYQEQTRPLVDFFTAP
jgi:adenylate kinase